MKSDRFGLKNVNFFNENAIESLNAHIIKFGFKDYSDFGISSFFSFRYPILEHTMFKEYTRLDTGSYLDEREKKYYWKPVFELNKNIAFNEAVEETEKLLIESIDKLIKPYKRIGVTLSGGLDSSLIVAMIKKHYPDKELYTYSAGFDGLNEFEYSRIIAKEFSDFHREILIGRDEFLGEDSLFRALVKHKAAPVHPNEVALAISEQKARFDLCDIVLCGEGSDDIFGGYGQLLRMPVNYHENSEAFYTYFLDRYRYFTHEEVHELLHDKYIVNDLDLVKTVFNEDECPIELTGKILYFIQRVHTRGLIERGANALSFNMLPNGFPYIDDVLVDYVNSLPFEYKVSWKDGVDLEQLKDKSYKEISEQDDIPKFILKKIAKAYLPNEIIYRKKVGFPVPYATWFEDFDDIKLNESVFKIKDISHFDGWKKFMIFNLNTFIEIFESYRVNHE